MPVHTAQGQLKVSNEIAAGTIIGLYRTSLPSGWKFCDGTNGTPDLRGAMIIGDDAVGQGEEPVFSDNFNRANENVEATAPWTQMIGGAGAAVVDTNQVRYAVTGTVLYRWDTTTQSKNLFAQFSPTNTPAFGIGICVRVDPSTGDRYQLFWRVGTGFRLERNIGGVSTTLATAIMAAPSLPFTMRIEVRGTTLHGLINGAQVVTASDSNIPNGTRAGFTSFNSQNATFDDFSTGTIATPYILGHENWTTDNHTAHTPTQPSAHSAHSPTQPSAHSDHIATQASAHGTHSSDGTHTHDAHATEANGSTAVAGTKLTGPATHSSDGAHTHDAHPAHSGWGVNAHSAHSGFSVDAHSAHAAFAVDAHSAHASIVQPSSHLIKAYVLSYVMKQ